MADAAASPAGTDAVPWDAELAALAGGANLQATPRSAASDCGSSGAPPPPVVSGAPDGDAAAVAVPVVDSQRPAATRAAVAAAAAALVVSVVAMSSGGIWFALLSDTPPVMKAAWRLTLTAVAQAPGFAVQWRAASRELRARWWRHTGLLAATGAVLAGHFASWSASLNMTSLTHALLFVTATPMLLVAAYSARHCFVVRCASRARCAAAAARCGDAATARMPTPLELGGTFVGFGAAAVLAATGGGGSGGPAASSIDVPPSAGGDAMALVGAATFGVYLWVGSRVRGWMPLFLYATPVTAAAAVVAAVVSAAAEPAVVAGGGVGGAAGVFGWLTDGDRFKYTLGGAVGAGMLGHTLCNYALVHISSLVVSVALLMEPVIGSIFGYLAGVQDVPDARTLAVGPFLLAGAALVTVGGHGSAASLALDRAAAAAWRRLT